MKSYGRPYKALLRAVRLNQFSDVRQALEAGVNPREHNALVIGEAVRLGRIHMLELFVQSGIALTGLDDGPLEMAAKINRLDVIQYLIGLNVFPRADLNFACAEALYGGFCSALTMLMAAGAELRQPVDFCVCTFSDSVECFSFLVGLGYNPQPQIPAIVTYAVRYSSHKLLRFVLQHYQVAPQLLNNLLSQAVHRSSVRTVKILISGGAIWPVECTQAFNGGLSLRRVRSAKLLLKYIDVTKVDAFALERLAGLGQWKLLKKLLKRGTPADRTLWPYAALTLICNLQVADFIPDDPKLNVTSQFYRERIEFCQELACSAGRDSRDGAVKAVWWLVEIRQRYDQFCRRARRPVRRSSSRKEFCLP